MAQPAARLSALDGSRERDLRLVPYVTVGGSELCEGMVTRGPPPGSDQRASSQGVRGRPTRNRQVLEVGQQVLRPGRAHLPAQGESPQRGDDLEVEQSRRLSPASACTQAEPPPPSRDHEPAGSGRGGRVSAAPALDNALDSRAAFAVSPPRSDVLVRRSHSTAEPQRPRHSCAWTISWACS